MPPSSCFTGSREEYAEALGAMYMADFVAWFLDPFWMLTIRPPRNWAVPWIKQAIIEAVKQYHKETYTNEELANDDLIYYAAILYSHRSKRWHAHLLCQRLPLYPNLLVRCFEEEFGHRPGVVDLKDRSALRAEAASFPEWQQEEQPIVDYRAYVAGPRNILGHYLYDSEGVLEPHVDVFSPILRTSGAASRDDAPRRLATGSPAAPGRGIEPQVVGDIKPADASSHTAPSSDPQPPTNPALPLGRQLLVGLRLVGTEEESDGALNLRYIHEFRDDEGRRYRWPARTPQPVNVRGYRHPGPYSVMPGVSLTFAATVRKIWPDGTVKISRPYFRLDQQPEAARRAYAEECDIRLRELGLEPESAV